MHQLAQSAEIPKKDFLNNHYIKPMTIVLCSPLAVCCPSFKFVMSCHVMANFLVENCTAKHRLHTIIM